MSSQWMGTSDLPPGAAAQVVHLGARVPGRAVVVSYTVRPGDSLSGIAERFYGSTRWWPGLYEVNRVVVGADPWKVDAGIVLRVPSRPDTRAKTPLLLGHRHAVYRPQHATRAAAVPAVPAAPAAVPANGGTYSFSGLERIWTAVGGSAATAPHAACIAEHESSGRPGAISASGCFGLWQIMGDRAALDPATGARKAVHMSQDGTNWSPWSTSGMC